MNPKLTIPAFLAVAAIVAVIVLALWLRGGA